MSPERLAEIRAHVGSKYGYQGQPSEAERAIAELLAEIDALTRERDELFGAGKALGIEYARLKAENARLAADVAKLREAIMELRSMLAPGFPARILAERVLLEISGQGGTG